MIQTLQTKIDIPTRFKNFKDVPVSIDFKIHEQSENGFDLLAIEYMNVRKNDGKNINRLFGSLPDDAYDEIDGKILEIIE